MHQMAPYHALKDITMKDTWSVGPLSKFTFEERRAIKVAMKDEIDRYQDIAAQRFPERTAKESMMMSEEEQQVRAEVMRRNCVQQLKHKHMHEFRRKMVDQILKEREKLPGYLQPNKKEDKLHLSGVEKSRLTQSVQVSSTPSAHQASTADQSPSSKMTH